MVEMKRIQQRIEEGQINDTLPLICSLNEIKAFCNRGSVNYVTHMNLRDDGFDQKGNAYTIASCRVSPTSGPNILYSLVGQGEIVIEDTPEAKRIAELLAHSVQGSLEDVAKNISLPRFNSDRQSEIVKSQGNYVEELERILKRYRIMHPIITRFNPHSNEEIERRLGKAKESLRELEQKIEDYDAQPKLICPGEYVGYATNRINKRNNTIHFWYGRDGSKQVSESDFNTEVWIPGKLTLEALKKFIAIVNPTGKMNLKLDILIGEERFLF